TRTNLVALARKEALQRSGFGAVARGHPYGADGFVGGPTGGAGDAGDCERRIDRKLPLHALGHRAHDLFRYRAILIEQLRRNLERTTLHDVVVRDDASDEDFGSARNGGDPRAQDAAGT